VVATANDISHLPPELLRKGRLDELFFVDLPEEQERVEIFRIHLRRRGRLPEKFDLAALAAQSDNYSGAEIEQAVISGLFEAFSRQTELTTAHVLEALQQAVPLSRTMSEQINGLRARAKPRAPAHQRDAAMLRARRQEAPVTPVRR
jgi:SpoVK/Ycf46/Vps4 family AAA+-type ATPase